MYTCTIICGLFGSCLRSRSPTKSGRSPRVQHCCDKVTSLRLLVCIGAPRVVQGFQESPESFQESPESYQESSRLSQDSHEIPERSQEGPESSEENPQSSQESPESSQESPRSYHESRLRPKYSGGSYCIQYRHVFSLRPDYYVCSAHGYTCGSIR